MLQWKSIHKLLKLFAEENQEPVLLRVEAGVVGLAVLALPPPQLLNQLLREQKLLRRQRSGSLQDSAPANINMIIILEKIIWGIFRESRTRLQCNLCACGGVCNTVSCE